MNHGSMLMECGQRRYILNEGNAFFINSNVLHAMSNYGSSERASAQIIIFDASVVGGAKDSVFYERYISPLIRNASLPEYVWTPQAPETALTQVSDNLWVC